MNYLIVFLLLISGCGVKVKSDPIKVDKIVVEHHIVLDTDVLYKSYQAACKTDLPSTATQEEINKCADDKLNTFIANFTHMS